MSKEAPPEGDTFNGVFIPGRTKIGYCGWGLFRDREIWGEDVHTFRPERWLDSSAEKIHIMEATMELVFGYGRWQYLGKNVALIELNKVFVEVTLPSKCQRREELMKYYSCYGILNCLLCIH